LGLAGFGIFVGSITSLLTEIRLIDDAGTQYLYKTMEELPDDKKFCVPKASYTTNYKAVARLHTTHPGLGSLSANIDKCFEDFKKDLVKGVVYDEPNLLHTVNRENITDVVFIKSTHDIVLSSAWSGRYVHSHRNDFEQGFTVAQAQTEHFERVYNSYFPKLDVAAQSTEPVYETWLIVLGVLVGIYFVTFTTALIYRDCKLGHCKRCVNIAKNKRRSRRLSSIIDSKDDGIRLPEPLVAIFKTIDDNNNGYLEMSELEMFNDKLTETGLAEEGITQINQMLLTIFENDVDGRLSLQEFSDAYQTSISAEVKENLSRALGASPKHKRSKAHIPTEVRQRMVVLRERTKELKELIAQTYTR